MNRLLVIMIVLLLCPSVIMVEAGNRGDDRKVRSSIIVQNLDTMDINQVIEVRNSCNDSATNYPDFVLSKTEADKGLKKGLFWEDGTVVSLPSNFVPGLVELEKQDTSFIISWFSKDNNGGYSFYLLPLPDLKDNGSLPRKVSIEPMLEN